MMPCNVTLWYQIKLYDVTVHASCGYMVRPNGDLYYNVMVPNKPLWYNCVDMVDWWYDIMIRHVCIVIP